MGEIFLKGICFEATHGVFKEEKEKAQKFEVDIKLCLNLEKCAKSDCLCDTIDYTSVVPIVKETANFKNFNLVESLATQIVKELFFRFPPVYSITITIRKPKANVVAQAQIEITIQRDRNDFFPSTVYIGLGSNMGIREALLEEALQRIETLPKTLVVKQSPIYETTSIGVESSLFLNQVAEIQTQIPPLEFQKQLQKIETIMGRERKKHWGDRTIDIDILYYNSYEMNHPYLILPHPEIKYRAFVIKPLLDIKCPFITEQDLEKVKNQKIMPFSLKKKQ